MNEEITFLDLGLKTEITDVLTKVGYEHPTPVQLKSIPTVLNGGDLLAQAQTGTGKTAAFALPLLSNLDISKKLPQILVLTPTRELAIQVSESFSTYAQEMDHFRTACLYGGQSITQQFDQLKRKPQVIVGTPGRVMDHIRRKTLRLGKVATLVLDEADEMLRMGFKEDIEWILEYTPEEKQIALFSATMPAEIKRVAHKYLKDPEEIYIKAETNTADKIDQQFWSITGIGKLEALTRMLEVEPTDGCIVFTRTKTATMQVAEDLLSRGHKCTALNGDMSQDARERAIEQLKNGRINVVVATDVAARGLDVDRMSHVFNYDMPENPEIYIHRIGRTGRAGRAGKAILFVSPRQTRALSQIEKKTKKKITEYTLPNKKDVVASRIQRFKEEISTILNEGKDLDLYQKAIEELSEEQGHSALEIAAALALASQKDAPFKIEEQNNQSKSSRSRESGRSRSRDSRRSHSREERRAKPKRAKQRDAQHDTRRDRRRSSDSDMKSHRFEVGKKHGAHPGAFVRVITSTIGLSGEDIGSIDMHDTHSTIALPKALPREAVEYLHEVISNNDGQKRRAPAQRRGTGRKGKRNFRRRAKR